MNAQYIVTMNEYVRAQHYSKILKIARKDGEICGLRIAKLTLCDPTVPNAVDIQEMVKLYFKRDAEIMFENQKLATLEIDATLES
jgi:hypothetical protein